ncbi:uncharacterized protein LOC119071017 [Bradysia coprophila]|uniref:uncharacterized protein LOC119071017 n=1 Tax=Bradysia coprophila TaxID=38358 RepID=UPI00187DD38E|nr:uncharacterized protein LOC119071017 [Bradysia coprophila]
MFQRNILLGLITLTVVASTYSLDIKTVLEQPLLVPTPKVVATSLVLTFPPGDEGTPPHFHPGPVVGYVIKGSFLFQVGTESPRIIKAGEAFYETDGITHVWGANASDDTPCEVVVTLYGRPGEPILTLVDGVERASRAEALALAAPKV